MGKMANVQNTSEQTRVPFDWRPSLAQAGVVLGVGLMLLVLALEPALNWFVVPTVLVGIVVAFVLRSSKLADSQADQGRPEIQISRIPVKGGMGLVFTGGSIAIFCIALPEARWFLGLAVPVGALIGLTLHTWHKRHPIT
ncbi:MAG TPA: hypothetical protein VKG87_14160 [Terriglobales bacterium]|nr:hypothetical protein [Terriglobales bacterium]